MTTAQDRALEIINAWIGYAQIAGKGKHTAEFWTVRDILEGVLRVSPGRAAQAVAFVRTECKPSDDRDALVAALEERGYK
jgi:hypothetical protein